MFICLEYIKIEAFPMPIYLHHYAKSPRGYAGWLDRFRKSNCSTKLFPAEWASSA